MSNQDDASGSASKLIKEKDTDKGPSPLLRQSRSSQWSRGSSMWLSNQNIDPFFAPMTDPGYPTEFMRDRAARMRLRSGLDESLVSSTSSLTIDPVSPSYVYPPAFTFNEASLGADRTTPAEVPISESLRTPPAFGTDEDWTTHHRGSGRSSSFGSSMEFSSVFPPRAPTSTMSGIANLMHMAPMMPPLGHFPYKPDQEPIGTKPPSLFERRASPLSHSFDQLSSSSNYPPSLMMPQRRQRGVSFTTTGRAAARPLLSLNVPASLARTVKTTFVDDEVVVDTSPGFLARPYQPAAPPATVAGGSTVEGGKGGPSVSPTKRLRNQSSSNSSTSSGEDCSYCRSVNLNAEGHTKRSCPVLSKMSPCSICGASGVDNHTETHCPNQPMISLEFIPKERRHPSSI